MPSAVQRATASRDSGRISSSSASAPSDPAVHDDMEHGHARLVPRVCGRHRGSRPRSARSRGPPTATVWPSTIACAPRPGSASKPRAGGQVDRRALRGSRRCRAPADAPNRPRRPQRASAGRVSVRRRSTPTSAGRPCVSVPVLSKMTTSELARPLEREPVLDEQAVAGAKRGGDRDHERDREAERVRAGDHEHGRACARALLRVAHAATRRRA